MKGKVNCHFYESNFSWFRNLVRKSLYISTNCFYLVWLLLIECGDTVFSANIYMCLH